jgi:hypothetical protein
MKEETETLKQADTQGSDLAVCVKRLVGRI